MLRQENQKGYCKLKWNKNEKQWRKILTDYK